MIAGHNDNTVVEIPTGTSLGGWLTMTADADSLPAGYQFLERVADAAPAEQAIRPDLLPLCMHADGRYLCAQLSPMGRAMCYGEWSEVAGWSPWTPHWEGVLVTLWALEALKAGDKPVDARFHWIGNVWTSVQEQSAGLPGWSTFSRQRGPEPLMTLLERGVAPYPAILALSAWFDGQPSAAPDNLEPLLVRERCRLWRSVDPSENSLQQVVKAVYAVQAMRRGEFDCRQPDSDYALNLSAVLQDHWQHVPEPLRDDHLIKAARDGRASILARTWADEAAICRQRQHYAEACRAMSQVWCAEPTLMSARLRARWLQDTRHADSECWQTLLTWHGFVPPEEAGQNAGSLQALTLQL
ncbi:hypothetical protein E4656_09260 [Natronospirillum operosum]|uniref:Uncharacterized protein n=1 Tax=Natronospirillum operosum TaxID=2759953 RepID=A0A4Z0WFC1_9GAMM|nr:hypothetical protein [Natronospirillum operosum]TGG93238.1 hypothetical protein E4656_09260 [Natronospirillum operosum]